MCGITGFWHRSAQPADPQLLDRMCRAIAHRGPDDSGSWIDGDVALGHLRLSIIDLTPSGHQPMPNENGALQIVFNGEIYNYLELHDQLVQLGHRFRSRSDTEVILHAWEEWGSAALSRFRGMWAFALWDGRRRELVLARDRIGIKPLYWTRHGSTIGFGSEIKALLPLQPDRTPDLPVVYSLAIYQQRTDPRSTCFTAVSSVAPGTLLRIDAESIREEQWFDAQAEEDAAPDNVDPATLRRLLDESVALHLRSDVPVGACLSGGLDSSALVALAVPRLPHALNTFSVVYPGTAQDERHFVEQVCARYPTMHHHEQHPDGSDALDVLNKAVWHFEEPLWGEASYSWWKVMELVAAHGIKVVVNGQGADELLGGYPYYYPSYLRQLAVTGHPARFVRELRAEAAHQKMSNAQLLRHLAAPVWPQWLRRALRPVGIGRSWRDDQLGPLLRSAAPTVGGAEARRGFWSLEQHLRSDFSVSRLPMLLQAEDRFSMAHSIESRVPFLDAPLVAWANRLPATAKLRDGITKYALREAMRGDLPAPVVDRMDKKGYPTPGNTWFRGPLSDAIGDRLASSRVDTLGLLDGAVMRKRFDRFRRGERMMPDLWRLLTLQEWGEQFLAS